MDYEQTLELGGYCSSLLSNSNFQFLCAAFEQQQVDVMLLNKPNDEEQRDRISRIQGYREFLSWMGTIIQRQQELLDAVQEPEDHSDDPSVHDIFNYEPDEGVTD